LHTQSYEVSILVTCGEIESFKVKSYLVQITHKVFVKLTKP